MRSTEKLRPGQLTLGTARKEKTHIKGEPGSDGRRVSSRRQGTKFHLGSRVDLSGKCGDDWTQAREEVVGRGCHSWAVSGELIFSLKLPISLRTRLIVREE